MDQDKTVNTTKKSAIKIVDLLAKETMATVIPRGGLLYDTVKALIIQGRSYFSDRTEKRIDEFHSALLNGKKNEEEFSSFINKPFDLDDYYAVLSSCAQDIENEKVEIYSTLMGSLIDSELNPQVRRHLIKSCKEFSYSELCFLKDLFINSKHDLMTVGGVKRQVINMLTSHDPFLLLTINKLKSFGFIDAKGESITLLAESFVSLIFSARALTPESLGCKPFSGINVVIVSYQLGEETHNNIATEVQEALWSKQIKSSIHVLDEHRLNNSVLFYGAAVLIVDDKLIASEHIDSLVRFSKKRPIIRLNADETSHVNLLAEINFADELTLKSTERTAIRSQVNEYISRHMA